MYCTALNPLSRFLTYQCNRATEVHWRGGDAGILGLILQATPRDMGSRPVAHAPLEACGCEFTLYIIPTPSGTWTAVNTNIKRPGFYMRT